VATPACHMHVGVQSIFIYIVQCRCTMFLYIYSTMYLSLVYKVSLSIYAYLRIRYRYVCRHKCWWKKLDGATVATPACHMNVSVQCIYYVFTHIHIWGIHIYLCLFIWIFIRCIDVLQTTVKAESTKDPIKRLFVW